MERLTKNNDTQYDLIGKYSSNVEEFTFNHKLRDKVLNKLGEIEDLEEQIGCPLDVVFKALKQGFVYCCDDFDEDILEKWEVSHFTNYKGLGWCLQNISGVNVNFKHNSYEATYDFKSEVFLLKNYKNTWWLKENKEE